MTSIIRSAVSKKKVRYQTDGFDLDLTYITPKIIAMGYPSDGVEGKYRNPMTEVQRFFKKYHDGHFFIYNLCSERSYDPSKFQGACHRLPFPDHNPPSIGTINDFCTHVERFLGEDEKNVVAVHCKAGKGRTGVMIASYLIYSGIAGTTEEALTLFGDIRTHNGKGVTIPSQQRYVGYYGDIVLKKKTLPDPQNPKLILFKKLRMFTMPNFDVGGGCDPYFRIFCHRRCQIKSTPIKSSDVKAQIKENGYIDFDIDLVVWSDVKFDMIDHDRMSKDDKMFQFWFNTDFIDQEEWTLNPSDIDGPHKDKHHKHFSADFKVIAFFDLEPGVGLEPRDFEKVRGGGKGSEGEGEGEEEGEDEVNDPEELFSEDDGEE